MSILIKRNKICSALAQADMRPYIPQGAYYVLADMAAVPRNSGNEKAMNLLKKTGEIFLYWQLPRDE
ncbi:MAG: hypothetical protein Q8K46_01645 [Deltaproteobacteria bacterium]|nr:hypothetical protein [Deltaproteobacteria bacterium]